MTKYTLHFLIGLVVALSALGCGRGGPDVVPIEGAVTHNGEPVPNVRIYFAPTDGRPSWAVSDEKGHFALAYDIDHQGAKVGTHKVWIQDEAGNIDPTAAMSGGASSRPRRSPQMALAIDKYGKEKTPLTAVEIKKADRNYQLKLD